MQRLRRRQSYSTDHLASALFVCAKPALAADNALDVSELTRDQFLEYDDNNKGLIMMWLRATANIGGIQSNNRLVSNQCPISFYSPSSSDK
jgi:hypothetical protein